MGFVNGPDPAAETVSVGVATLEMGLCVWVGSPFAPEAPGSVFFCLNCRLRPSWLMKTEGSLQEPEKVFKVPNKMLKHFLWSSKIFVEVS